MGTKFTDIYNRFLGKITDDLYIELTPEDTIKDLRAMLLIILLIRKLNMKMKY